MSNNDDVLFASNLKASSVKKEKISVCESVNLLTDSIVMSDKFSDEVLLEDDD